MTMTGGKRISLVLKIHVDIHVWKIGIQGIVIDMEKKGIQKIMEMKADLHVSRHHQFLHT